MDCEDCNSPPPTFLQNIRERVGTVLRLLIDKVLGEQTECSTRLNVSCKSPCCPCNPPITKEEILDQLIRLTCLCETCNVERGVPNIPRDKPGLKRKRPHESISEHDTLNCKSLQQFSKDRRHGSIEDSENVQHTDTQTRQAGRQIGTRVSECVCDNELMMENEEVIKKMSFIEMNSSSSEINLVAYKCNGGGNEIEATSNLWLQSPSLEKLLRDTIKARVDSIINIVANKFTSLNESKKTLINENHICDCHPDNQQNVKLETLELAINATDELRNEFKFRAIENNTAQQRPENKIGHSDIMQQHLTEKIKKDILALVTDVVNTWSDPTLLTELPQGQENFDYELSEPNNRNVDEGASQSLRNIIQNFDYSNVSTIIPSTTEEILMESILDIVKSTKIQLDNFVESMDDYGSSPRKLKSITSEELFTQIIDVIIHTAMQLKEQEMFPHQETQYDTETHRSPINTGLQQRIVEGIKQSVSHLIISTSDKFMKEAILGSEQDENSSSQNWYPPLRRSIEKEVMLQTLNAVISAAETLKLRSPVDHTITIHHSTLKVIMNCISDVKKLLCILDLISEILNDLKSEETQKNKIGNSTDLIQEIPLHDSKKHLGIRRCICTCCKSLHPLFCKKKKEKDTNSMTFEDNASGEKSQTKQTNSVQDLWSQLEISENKFDGSGGQLLQKRKSYDKSICSAYQGQNSQGNYLSADGNVLEQTPIIDKRYTEEQIKDIIQNHVKEVSSNSLSFSSSNLSLTDEDDYERETAIYRRYPVRPIEEAKQGKLPDVSSDLVSFHSSKPFGTGVLCDGTCSVCQCQISQGNSSLTNEEEFYQVSEINRRHIEGPIEDATQDKMQEVSSASMTFHSNSKPSKINNHSEPGVPCNTCSVCLCQRDSNTIVKNKVELVSVNNRRNTELAEEIMHDNMQEVSPLSMSVHSNSTDKDELEQVSVINRRYTEGLIEDIMQDHIQGDSSFSFSHHISNSSEITKTTNVLCDTTCSECQCQLSQRYSNITPSDEFEQAQVINRRYTEGLIEDIMQDHIQEDSSFLFSHHISNSSEITKTTDVLCDKTCSECQCQPSQRYSNITPSDEFEQAQVINRRYAEGLIEDLIQDHIQEDSSFSFSHHISNSSEITKTTDVLCDKTCSECQCQLSQRYSNITPSDEFEQAQVINRRYTADLIEEIIHDHTQKVSLYLSFLPTSKSSETRKSIGAGDNAISTSKLFLEQPSLEKPIRNEITKRIQNILNITANKLMQTSEFSDKHLNHLAATQDINIRTLDIIINIIDELKSELKNQTSKIECHNEKDGTKRCHCKVRQKNLEDRIKLDILDFVTDIVNTIKNDIKLCIDVQSGLDEPDKNFDKKTSKSFQNYNYKDSSSVVLRPIEEILMEKILDIVKSITFQLDNIDDSESFSQRIKSTTSQEFSQIIDNIIHSANQYMEEVLHPEHLSQQTQPDIEVQSQKATKLNQQHIVEAIKQRVSHLIFSITGRFLRKAVFENLEQILEDGIQDIKTPFEEWYPPLRHSLENLAMLYSVKAVINAASKLKENPSVQNTNNTHSSTDHNDSYGEEVLVVLNHISEILSDMRKEESQEHKPKKQQIQEKVFKVSTDDSKTQLGLHTCICSHCKSNYPFDCKKGKQKHEAPLKKFKNPCTEKNHQLEQHLVMNLDSHKEIFDDKLAESVNKSQGVSSVKSKRVASKSQSTLIQESNSNMMTDVNELVHKSDLNKPVISVETKVNDNQGQEDIKYPCSTCSLPECSKYLETFYHPSQPLDHQSEAKININGKSSFHPPSPISCVKSTCPFFQKDPSHQSQAHEGIAHEVAKDISDLIMNPMQQNHKSTTPDRRCQRSCTRNSLVKLLEAQEETKTQKKSLSEIRSDEDENDKIYTDKLKWYIQKLVTLSKQEVSQQKTNDPVVKANETKSCCVANPEAETHSETNIHTLDSVTEAILDKLLTVSCKCKFPIEKLNHLLHIISKTVESTSNENFEKLIFETSADTFAKKEEKIAQNAIQSCKTLILGQHFDNKPTKTKPTDDINNIHDNICEWKMNDSNGKTTIKKELNVVDVIPLKFSEDQISRAEPRNNENERRKQVCFSLMKEMTLDQLKLQLDEWFKDLGVANNLFAHQSNFVIKNDFILAHNREKLEFLHNGIARCSNSLDFIEKSLRECDELHCECLSVHSMYLNTDFKGKGERENMYMNLLRVKQSLNETSMQKDMINECIKDKLNNSYVTRITRILNCYANTLQGVEYKIQVLGNELQAIKYLSSAVLSKLSPI